MITPNKYRFILGKSTDTSVNLVNNGTFTGGGTGWTTYGTTQWAFAGNEASVRAAQCGGGAAPIAPDLLLSNNGIITPNEFYYLEYKMKAALCVSSGLTKVRMAYSIGGTYMNYYDDYDETTSTSYTTFTHNYLFAPAGDDLFFYAGGVAGLGYIDNVVLYRYVWNQPLTYEPIDWDTAKISKRRDEQLNGLIIEYIANLTFIEDGYDYLYDQYTTNGFCGEVPVRIEVYNSVTGFYELYFEGIIFINDCEFNITKRQVKVKIEDKNASLLFIRSKDVKVDLEQVRNSYKIAPMPLLVPDPEVLIDFNDDTGAYAYPNIYCFNIATLLRTIIIKSTRYRLDAESDIFSVGGDFEYYCIGYAAQLMGGGGGANPTVAATKVSINELFSELNKIANLTFSTTTNADGVPTIKIEAKTDYLSATPVLTLNYVNDISFIFDKANIIRTVSIGYDKVDVTAIETGRNSISGDQYYSNNLCSEVDLNLVNNYIGTSAVLKRLLDGTITGNKYEGSKFIIDTDGTQTNNSGSGTYDYNVNIGPEDNMARWIETLQFGFLKTNTSDTTILTKSNATLDKIYSFKYPLTKAQFDLIVQAYNTIEFNTDGTGFTTKAGYLLSADYDIKTGLTEFKLLAG